MGTPSRNFCFKLFLRLFRKLILVLCPILHTVGISGLTDNVFSYLLGLFDSYGLFSDMLAHPQNYLNGTGPLNITGAVQSCVLNINESTSHTGDCNIATGTDVDNYLWWVWYHFISILKHSIIWVSFYFHVVNAEKHNFWILMISNACIVSYNPQVRRASSIWTSE